MSLLKSVRKVFKRVTKSKVGAFAVGAAASYFTAGMGATILGSTGLGATLTPAMNSVLSHALSGAIAGGAASALGGEDVGKGALFGAAGGAVMGGVQATLSGTPTGTPSAGTPPAAGAKNTQLSIGPAQQGGVSANAGGSPGAAQATPVSTGGQKVGLMNVPFSGTPNMIDTSQWGEGTSRAFFDPSTGSTVNVQGTGRMGLMGWADRNPEVVGKMVAEGASGALSAVAGGGSRGVDYTAATEARIAADQAETDRVVGSHQVTGGLMATDPSNRPVTGLMPTQRFNTPETAMSDGRWVYDQSKGRVVFVPNQPQQVA